MPSCICQCHNWLRGNHRALYHRGNFMNAYQWAQRAKLWDEIKGYVDAGDALEAVLACKACLDAHTPALGGPPPPLRPQPPREQADGWTDPPREGRE